MVGWNHQLDGQEFEQTLGDGKGQGALVCCSPWGCEESDRTDRLNNNNKNRVIFEASLLFLYFHIAYIILLVFFFNI